MRKKTSLAALWAAQFRKKPTLLAGSLLAALLLLGLFAPVARLSAQGCQTEAAFTAIPDGADNCLFTFVPQYNGTGTVLSHLWTFRNGISNMVSSSDQPVPIHQFDAGTTGTVTHTITVLEANGQTVTYTCSNPVIFNCTTGCVEPSFTYAVTGCTVAFTAQHKLW